MIQFYFLPSELAGNSIKSEKIYDRFDKFQSVQSGAWWSRNINWSHWECIENECSAVIDKATPLWTVYQCIHSIQPGLQLFTTNNGDMNYTHGRKAKALCTPHSARPFSWEDVGQLNTSPCHSLLITGIIIVPQIWYHVQAAILIGPLGHVFAYSAFVSIEVLWSIKKIFDY